MWYEKYYKFLFFNYPKKGHLILHSDDIPE